jgi:hypothetical protein
VEIKERTTTVKNHVVLIFFQSPLWTYPQCRASQNRNVLLTQTPCSPLHRHSVARWTAWQICRACTRTPVTRSYPY